MADFSKPLLTDTYTSWQSTLTANITAALRWLDPATSGTHTAVPSGAYRLNAGVLERYSGSAWVAATLKATQLATARTLTIGNTSKSFDGSTDVSWSLAEIGAPAVSSVINADGNYLVQDTRSVDTPTDMGDRGVRYEFKSNATDGLHDGGLYHAVMTFQQWGDSTGGNTHQLGFTGNGNLWYRTAPIGGTWGPWRKIYHSDNINTANAGTATKLQTARTLTIGNTGKSFDGSANVSWTLAEIGAVANGGSVSTIVKLTQAAYDALGTKDANTLYVIVG